MTKRKRFWKVDLNTDFVNANFEDCKMLGACVSLYDNADNRIFAHATRVPIADAEGPTAKELALALRQLVDWLETQA